MALLGGCAQEEVVVVSRWTVFAPGAKVGVPVTIPRHLDDLLPRTPCAYRLEARTRLPASMRGRTLTLAVPHLYANASLLVNGVEMVELAPEATPTYRSRGTLRFRIPHTTSARGTLDLTLRVTHTWTQSGWLDTPARISATMAGDRFSSFVESFNQQGAWFGFVTVFVIWFTSLLMFVLDRRQVGFAWFAIEAAFGMSMPLFQMGTSRSLFGVYDGVMLAVGVSVGLWASVRFTHVQFGLPKPHYALDVLLFLTLLLIASGLGPFVVTRRAALTVIAFISVNVIYQLWVTTRLFQSGVRSVHGLVLAASWAALGLSASADQLAWLGMGELWGGVRGAPLGLSVIALLQAGVLSHDYIKSLKHADSLNLELADRVRLLESKNLENVALNEVLRRQIAARSEQLAHAVVRRGAAREVAPETSELAPGFILENRYRIVSVLGRGGMGTVYEVVRLIDDRTFALKVLSGRGGSVEMARFAREAQLVAQLQHPHVVSIVDVDVATNGLLFIVLELVRGNSLRAYMDRAPHDRPFALRVLAQVADALAGIHQSRIIHRDLKPDNILVLEDASTQQITVKITDFGVSAMADATRETHPRFIATSLPPSDHSKVTARVSLKAGVDSRDHREAPPQHSDQGLTQAGMLIGTPRYLAPESTEHTSTAIDIFAFGIVAFELLIGEPPFREPLVTLRVTGRPLPPPPPLQHRAPDLDAELASLFERCLSADPSARPSAAELVRALRSYA